MGHEPRALSLQVVRKWEPLARKWGVSVVARSPAGFLPAYKRANGRLTAMADFWRRKRAAFVARHMAQAHKEPLFTSDGLPTRRHLALIMWAYSPAARRL